ncbi:hypothetical protein NA56DRAFT_747515 [Hyaloscypha hepaticicola]|uniref:Uncharacterized protein n=1 Tax=Hyaloscypha hepaticicola TaxID=2082293 RepID=A0A2J6Q9I2_9HELO|nr:hypothetical protein NA56DRAFT_747515 [Hyaloscypha hepaticicola]
MPRPPEVEAKPQAISAPKTYTREKRNGKLFYLLAGLDLQASILKTKDWLSLHKFRTVQVKRGEIIYSMPKGSARSHVFSAKAFMSTLREPGPKHPKRHGEGVSLPLASDNQ